MSRRKVERGTPRDEAKGSLDYMMMQIRRSFRAQFPSTDEWWPWVQEIFTDHVIVASDGELQPEEFYFVTYQVEGDRYVFAPREQWEVVELAYTPQTTESRPVLESRAGQRQKWVETIPAAVRLLAEDQDNPNGPWRIAGVGVTADVVNANGRRYPGPVLESALRRLRSHLNESAGQGRLKIESSSVLTGEADHPTSKGNRHPLLLETVINWTGVQYDGRHAVLSGKLLGTGNGRDVRAMMEGGVIPGISQRAYGESRMVEEEGQPIEEVTWLEITGYDLTAPYQQSDPEAGVTLFESQAAEVESQNSGDETMDLEELRKKYPHLVTQIEEEHDARKRQTLEEELQRQAAEDERKQRLLAEHDQELRKLLTLNETADITEAMRVQAEELLRLRNEKREREVSEYIESQTKDLPYNEVMRKSFIEAVKGAGPKTVEEAKSIIATKRKEYDAIQAQLVLESRGFSGGLRSLGPVIERELGVPEFARAGWMLQESMMNAGTVRRWDHRKPATAAELFAAKYLARFDEAYKSHLLREAKQLEEAEITTDLNLPYSVSRAIVAEALPTLIAADMFAFGTTDVSPFRLYYETFTGEAGYTGAATAETVAADLDAWVAMAYKRVTPGTVVVTNAGATVTYVEGADYVIDYASGRLRALTGGTITDGQSLRATYNYTAIRKGELAPIERGELNLAYKTMDAAADRLAQQISNEAVVFSRSQMGWDATQRTLAALVERVRRKIDQGALYMGLSAALSVAGNISGTWTSATDSLDTLIRLIGQASVKVHNRFYTPTGIIASMTNADVLSNWVGFKRDGFPDAVLNANGFVGRVKGLPLFGSTEFSDGYILVANRELVMHWVYGPMTIKGPFPTYDVSGGTGKLIAAEQYYAEEYNVTDAPVAEKGALVKIA